MKASAYAQALAAIEHCGPLSAREIAAEIGAPMHLVRAYCGAHKSLGHCHIAAWRRDDDGGVLYPRALYAFGPGSDAPKPAPLSRTEYNRRHRQRKARAVASVFALGQCVDQRRAAFDWRSVGGRV